MLFAGVRCARTADGRRHMYVKVCMIDPLIVVNDFSEFFFLVIYVIGKPFYTIKRPSGNMILNVTKCISNALKTRSRERHTNPRYHWLDYAEPKYGKTLVYDVKCLLKVLVLYIPLPIFWALFDQQGSRWTFQATRMDSQIGNWFSIKPDQMQVINPLIVVFCIPLFNLWIYPLLARMRIRTPLQKMTLGMVLCGLAFAMSGALEMKLEQSYPTMPKNGEGQLRIFNGQMCTYQIKTNIPSHQDIQIEPMNIWQEKYLTVLANSTARYTYVATTNSSDCPNNIDGEFDIQSGTAQSYLIGNNGPLVAFEEYPDKPKQSKPLLRILTMLQGDEGRVTFTHIDTKQRFEHMPNNTQLNEYQSGKYVVGVGNKTAGAIELNDGGTYTVLLSKSSNGQYVSLIVHSM